MKWIVCFAVAMYTNQCMCSPVIGEQLVLEKEPADQSTRWIYSGSDKCQSQIEGPTPYWSKFIHRSCGILLHEGALLSTVWCLSYFWKKEERKSLEVHVNIFYYKSTKDPAFNQDPVFIFLIMLFSHPLNENRHLYETSCNLRQYSIQ